MELAACCGVLRYSPRREQCKHQCIWAHHVGRFTYFSHSCHWRSNSFATVLIPFWRPTNRWINLILHFTMLSKLVPIINSTARNRRHRRTRVVARRYKKWNRQHIFHWWHRCCTRVDTSTQTSTRWWSQIWAITVFPRRRNRWLADSSAFVCGKSIVRKVRLLDVDVQSVLSNLLMGDDISGAQYTLISMCV